MSCFPISWKTRWLKTPMASFINFIISPITQVEGPTSNPSKRPFSSHFTSALPPYPAPLSMSPWRSAVHHPAGAPCAARCKTGAAVPNPRGNCRATDLAGIMRDIGRRRFPRILGVPNHPGFAKTILGDPHFKKPYGSWLFLWTYFTDLVNQQCEYMGLIRTGELNGHFTGQNRDLNDFKWIYNQKYGQEYNELV